MPKRRILAIAAGLGLLVPVVTEFLSIWGHVIFGSELLWVWPSSFWLLAIEGIAHPWVLIVIAVLANIALYLLIALLGIAIAAGVRGAAKK